MDSEKLAHYLRSHRKRLGLSQDELAWLMGSASGSKVSKYERFTREPSLKAVLAYEIVFGVPARELFAGVFEAVRMVTSRHARSLIKRLERDGQSTETAVKLAALRSIIESSEPGTPRKGHA